jgi:hypothetical protein
MQIDESKKSARSENERSDLKWKFCKINVTYYRICEESKLYIHSKMM